MEQKVLLYKRSRIVYYRFGSGSRPVICFHGYDEQANKYHFLEKYAQDRFSFYAFDLPFHGDSEWKEGHFFTAQDLQEVIALFVREELPGRYLKPSISLLGFSLGSRVALSLYEVMPGQFDQLLLLASDGFKVNKWYWFATQTSIGNRLFDFNMSHPNAVLWSLKIAGGMRLLNASVMKFCRYYLRDKKMSRLLYSRWTGLSRLRPNLPVIKSLIAEHSPGVTLVYGIHDRIIRPDNGERFCEELAQYCRVKMLNAGHMLFNEKHIAEILACLPDG